MSEKCVKCKKAISKDAAINCNSDDCRRKFHRNCVNIDDALFEAIEKNSLVTFNCEECKNQLSNAKKLITKIISMDDKLNKLNNTVQQIQGRMHQQSQFNQSNNNDLKKAMNNLVIVGSNCGSDRLKVVCDYGRWVQVGKFASTTTEADVIEHLSDMLKINKNLVKCTKLVKSDVNVEDLAYCKFKISIPDYRFNELFNDQIWPSGVMVSPFTPRSQINPKRL